MELKFNLKGSERKSLVGAISSALNSPAEYLGAPTFAYRVCGYRIDKEGTLTGPDNLELVKALKEQGFSCEIAYLTEPVIITVFSEEAGQEDHLLDLPSYEFGEIMNTDDIPALKQLAALLLNLPYDWVIIKVACLVHNPDNDNKSEMTTIWSTDIADGDALETEAAAPKRKGILDTLVDELNANAEDGEHWERLHRTPTIIDNGGREHNLDGTFAPMTEREELGLGRTRRDPVGEDGMQASDVPDSITIEVPFAGDGEILRSLLQSKASLIQKALGEDAFWYSPESEYSPENPGGWYGPAPTENILPIEFTDDTVSFEWFKFGVYGSILAAWEAFLCAAVEFSKTAKHVTAKDKPVESEKFAFRNFMVKIGMNDAGNKAHRKTLLRNLTGDAAFATKASKEKWLAKHGGSKKNTEVTADE